MEDIVGHVAVGISTHIHGAKTTVTPGYTTTVIHNKIDDNRRRGA
ncbi:MAG: hypothetical protein WAQ24_01900 [Candidatus Saccharimonadales bacterium]